MRLVPCAGCRRHADATARSCPFCGAALEDVAPSPRVRVGRLTRAAIFYLGATVASVGCSEPPPREDPIAQPYGAPPEPPPPEPPAPVYGGPPVEEPSPEPAPTESEPETDQTEPEPQPVPVPAYGAPAPEPRPRTEVRPAPPSDPGAPMAAYGGAPPDVP